MSHWSINVYAKLSVYDRSLSNYDRFTPDNLKSHVITGPAKSHIMRKNKSTYGNTSSDKEDNKLTLLMPNLHPEGGYSFKKIE